MRATLCIAAIYTTVLPWHPNAPATAWKWLCPLSRVFYNIRQILRQLQILQYIPSVVCGECVPSSDQQLFPHAGHLWAVEHELDQGIRQVLQQRQRDLMERPQEICQEGEGLDLGQLEVQKDVPVVICHLLRLKPCTACLGDCCFGPDSSAQG